jgi:hypothetical protein
VKPVVSLLLVSVLIGACAAIVATAICSLTSAALSPAGGALLGIAFGLSGGHLGSRGASRRRAVGTAVLRSLLAGGTSALVIALLQR